MASLAAAEPDARYAGLVCFSYPLHPPGAPERTDVRIAHWPAIACPVLLLSGESDPFARIDLLRAAVPRLRHGELVTYPRLGHTLKPVLDDVLDRVAALHRRASGHRLMVLGGLPVGGDGPYPDRSPRCPRLPRASHVIRRSTRFHRVPSR